MRKTSALNKLNLVSQTLFPVFFFFNNRSHQRISDCITEKYCCWNYTGKDTKKMELSIYSDSSKKSL